MRNEELQNKARQLRQTIFKVICEGQGGHIAGCMSVVEILTVLYHRILRVDPKNPEEPNRDRFILSKGHASVAWYAILAQKGFIDEDELATYGQGGTRLGGHPDKLKLPGVEASTGALGHGLAFGMGMAVAGKMDGKNYHTYVLLGDGECQEGSVWEAAMFAPQHKLDNLTVIIDYNKLQALDRLDKIVGLEPLVDKWESFGWEVCEVNGHDVAELEETLSAVPFAANKPSLIVAHTVKGKGISFMENVPIWHYRLPNDEEMKIACEQLQIELK